MGKKKSKRTKSITNLTTNDTKQLRKINEILASDFKKLESRIDNYDSMAEDRDIVLSSTDTTYLKNRLSKVRAGIILLNALIIMLSNDLWGTLRINGIKGSFVKNHLKIGNMDYIQDNSDIHNSFLFVL